MEDLQNAVNLLGALDTSMVLGIAITVAVLFVFLVIYDVIRRRRARARSLRRSGRSGSALFSPVGYFRRIRSFYQALDSELARRQHHVEQGRHYQNKWRKWRKWYKWF